MADVNPIHKKDVRIKPENYRPVSVLTSTSKVFERVLHDQINSKMKGVLSNKLCGYRKGYGSQHGGSPWIIKGMRVVFSWTYPKHLTMNHELLLAKLYAYGFSKNSIKTIHNYLKNRWQRVKINHSFSQWTELLLGVPQGSVLGPLLFNIYINDLMWFIENGEVCNYADDTTPYSCNKDLDLLKSNLEMDSLNAIEWFKNNYMKLNTDKCKLIVVGQKDHMVNINVGESNIEESKEVNLLGVIIDNDLSFKIHLDERIRKANENCNY